MKKTVLVMDDSPIVVQMPEIFGDELAQVLRHVRAVNAPILLFSSLPAATLAARTTEAGIDGFVCKDDGVPALVARVSTMLG